MSKKKGKGRGWWGEPLRHSQAAKKGWQKRYAKLGRYDFGTLKAIHEKRSARSRKIDESKAAKDVISPDDPRAALWVNNPAKYDILGIDYPSRTKSGVRPDRTVLSLKGLPTIERAIEFAKKEGVEVAPVEGKTIEVVAVGRGRVRVPAKWKIGEHYYELVVEKDGIYVKSSVKGSRKKKLDSNKIVFQSTVADMIRYGVGVECKIKTKKKLSKLTPKVNWKKLAEKYYKNYARRLGISYTEIPLKFKRGYVRAGGVTIFKNGKPVEVRLAEDRFDLFFAVDKQKAEKVLKFTIAHELAHIHYGHGKSRLYTFLKEDEADKLAEQISGVSRSEFDVLQMQLADKVNKALGEEIFVFSPRF